MENIKAKDYYNIRAIRSIGHMKTASLLVRMVLLKSWAKTKVTIHFSFMLSGSHF